MALTGESVIKQIRISSLLEDFVHGAGSCTVVSQMELRLKSVGLEEATGFVSN
jgi:hypothetical protein